MSSILLYRCSLWGVTKLDWRCRVRVDCTGELGTLYRLCLRSILNVSHTTRNSLLYILESLPYLSRLPKLLLIMLNLGQTVIGWLQRWPRGLCNWIVCVDLTNLLLQQ